MKEWSGTRPHSLNESYSERAAGPRVKAGTLKPLERKHRGESLCLHVSMDSRTPYCGTSRRETDLLDVVRIKTICASKDAAEKVKREPTEPEKTPANRTSDEKAGRSPTNGPQARQDTSYPVGHRRNANKDHEEVTAPQPPECLEPKGQVTSTGRVVEKQELPHATSGNVKWCGRFGKRSGSSSKDEAQNSHLAQRRYS